MDFVDRFGLDVPVAQAGMGPLARGRLAAAVANAGGLGTIGLLPPHQLRAAIGQVRAEAPGRTLAVNLLMPIVRRAQIEVCLAERVDVAVIAFGGNAALVRELRQAGVFVLVMVGTENQARLAIGWGADGLIAQGREAGGHVVGTMPALDFLPHALAIAAGRPVLLAGGIATAEDTATALAHGASAIVAGTRFLLTEESEAHSAYRQRVLAADTTIETTLFGLGWPARHRVIPNAATTRWCRADGSARRLPALINAGSAPLARIMPASSGAALLARQRPGFPLFTPIPPLRGAAESLVDVAALYAGESALRMDTVLPAKDAVARLTPPR